MNNWFGPHGRDQLEHWKISRFWKSVKGQTHRNSLQEVYRTDISSPSFQGSGAELKEDHICLEDSAPIAAASCVSPHHHHHDCPCVSCSSLTLLRHLFAQNQPQDGLQIIFRRPKGRKAVTWPVNLKKRRMLLPLRTHLLCGRCES